ncbi:hypothetical protein IIB50_00510 [Patescibacteria group bacterium]|nr:hypothetical protein [Patescibacteria group bacterium]
MNIFRKDISKIGFGILFLAIVVIFGGGFSDSGIQNTSVEVGVATLSPLGQAGGFAIPASCPSYVHVVGECNPIARISQDKGTTEPGESFVVSWSSTRASSCKVQHILPDGTYDYYVTVTEWYDYKAGETITSEVTEDYWATGLSGSKITVPTELGTHRYKNTCTNSLGSNTASINHTVALPPQCSDGIDNDSDGLTDLADPSCSGSSDNDESNPAQCSDGIDNDGDGFVDLADPGCISSGDNNEFNIFPQCSDRIDNDGDGLIDLADPGCTDPSDNNETAPPASLSLEASPINLIRSGTGTIIVWSATDVISCTISGPNGFNFTTTSGSQSTGPLTEQSTYTLSCETDTGPVSVGVTVNVLPVFEEI